MTLAERYNKEIVPHLMKKFGYKNRMQVPRVQKIVVNVGIGKNKDDAKFKELVETNVRAITGQKPIITLAKQSISNFKMRKGMPVGLKVTLRSKRMREFLEKLVRVTLPRIRDFQGLSQTCVDKHGNLNIGFREQVAFPEVKAESIEKLHGVQVTVSTNAKSTEEGMELFKMLGFVFKNR